jgi:hypothetical protein
MRTRAEPRHDGPEQTTTCTAHRCPWPATKAEGYCDSHSATVAEFDLFVEDDGPSGLTHRVWLEATTA